jgi:hypothetical protein
MGYDLHITRKQHWSDEGSDIAEEEWRKYVTSDPEFSLIGVAEAALPEGYVLRYENPLLAEWRQRPDHNTIWFDFRSGHVIVRNPDEETVAKMRQVAATLRAQVQGDQGELY